MQKWEYEILVRRLIDPEDKGLFSESYWEDDPELEASVRERLNMMGAQGWELISVRTLGVGVFVFKRPVKSIEKETLSSDPLETMKKDNAGEELTEEERKEAEDIQKLFTMKK